MFRQNKKEDKKEVLDFQKVLGEVNKNLETLPDMESEVSDLLNQINQSKLIIQELNEKMKQLSEKESQSDNKNQGAQRAGR